MFFALLLLLLNPWNQVWYYNAHMFSKEYTIGKFLVRFGVHRTCAESGVQSQSWPSFSTDRQRKIASLGSPTKKSINVSYDNHWCHIVTQPNNKVCVKYDPCACFIMSIIQFGNLSIILLLLLLSVHLYSPLSLQIPNALYALCLLLCHLQLCHLSIPD